MASEITDADTAPSPTNLDESLNGAGDARGNKRQRTSTSGIQDDDEDDESLRERRKIEIKFISDKSRRHITFSKRKAGIMKKVCISCKCLMRQIIQLLRYMYTLLTHTPTRLTSCLY